MKKRSFIIAFLIITTTVIAQTPSLQWAKNMGGLNSSGSGSSIAVKASSVYSTGSFRGKADFDPGAGMFYLTSAGSDDIFISKSNNAGTLLWAKQLGGSTSDFAKSIAVDGSGNVYTTGYFSGTADFDPGTGTFNLSSTGVENIFVSKLDASGNFVWAKQLGGASSDYGYSIAVDASSNIYVAGDFTGTADFDPGASAFNLSSFGFNDIFIVKLNSSGNFLWAKQLGGTSIDNCYSIAIDGSANIYTTGNFRSTADFNPDTGTFNLVSAGNEDIFISKLNAAGNFVWAKQLGGTAEDIGMDVTVDALGNIYSTGNFFGMADFDPGVGVSNLISAGFSDCYISKLDNSGNFSWVKQIGGTSHDYANSISLDGTSNIHTTGAFGGTVDFDPGTNVFNLTATGICDIFISKLNSSGSFIWTKKIGGYDVDSGNSLAVNSSGSVYYTGHFRGIVDFNPGAGTFNLDDPSGDFWPVFSQLNALGDFVWASSPCIYSMAQGNSTSVNLNGQIITVGQFDGTVDFDPGAGVFNMSTDSIDPWGDIFVTKTDSSGNFMWAKKLFGISENVANSVITDADGNIYVCGYFQATVDFDPGFGTFNLTAPGNTADIFLLKLDANGNFIWAKRIGGTLTDRGISLAIDVSGNLYITGYFRGTVDFDPGPAVLNLISSATTNTFIAKFNDSGILDWAKQTEGLNGVYANSISLDNFGNVYFAGYFFGTADFDPGVGVSNLISAGYSDCYISKLDNSGNFLWAKQFGGTLGDITYSIALDASSNAYITGVFNGTADFDPDSGIYNLLASGYQDIFISKLDASGTFIWAKQMGGPENENSYSIALDASASTYITGNFSGTADFDPDSANFSLTASGYNDIFISKLDDSGNFLWAKQFGGANQDFGRSIIIDSLGNIYTTGGFSGTADFDPGVGIYNLAATSYSDAFVLKMSECIFPLATIAASGPTSFCAGGSVTINANTGPGLTYQWLRNGITVSGATSSGYVVTTAGSYSVQISSSIACYSTSNSIVVYVPCIPIGPNHERVNQNTESNSETIKVSPNPTTGIFYIDAPSGAIQLFNSFGQHVGDYQIHEQFNTLDLSEFPEGVYILKLKTGEALHTKTIMLIR